MMQQPSLKQEPAEYTLVADHMAAEAAEHKAAERKAAAEQAEHKAAEAAERMAAVGLAECKSVGLAKLEEPAELAEPAGYFRPFSLHLQKQYK